MIAGQIEIQLMANIARLRADMDQARQTVNTTMGRISSAVSGAMKAFAGLAAGLSVAMFAGWVKGAIDAADAAGKLSAKTGVAVEDLAGLQLAFDLGGAGGELFSKSMINLSLAITEGNKGLDALGIKTKNANGQLLSNKEVLYQVADSISKMENGAYKAAMAAEIFGKKIGPELIPLLNGGAEGFRKMDEMARKLGLTMSQETTDSAEAFNDNLDLLSLGSQGVARGIAAELLPTMSSLSGSFLESMTSGDKLKKTADFLGGGLKMLYSIAVGVVEIFSTAGKIIGGVVAIATNQITGLYQALSKAKSGDFSGAWDTVKATLATTGDIAANVAKDVADGWQDTGKTISAAWSGEGNAAVEAQAKILRLQKDMLKAQEEREAAGKKAGAAADAARKKEQAVVEAAIKHTNDYIAALKLELAQVGLSTDQVKAMNVQREIALALEPKQREAIEKTAASLALATEQQKEYEAAQKKVADDNARWAQDTKDIDAQVVAMARQIETYGLTEVAVIDLSISKAEARIASGKANYMEQMELTDQIEKLKELRGLAGRKDALDIAKNAADEAKNSWKRTAESIENSLTDALMRGFESGKSFGRNLMDTLKNMFKTLILQPTIKGILAPVAGGIASALGFAAPAAAAAAPGAGSAASGALSLGSMATSIGSSIGAGFTAAWGAGGTLTGALSTGFASLTSGTMAGLSSGLGTIAGALGPIALGIGAAVAIWKKLDTSGTYHTGGASSASASGVTSVRAESLNFQGTRVNSEVEKMTAALASGIVGILDSTALAFGKAAGYTAATAFADDTSKDGAWGGLTIANAGGKVVDWQDTRTSRWAPKEFADGEAGKEQYLAALSASVRTALDAIGLPSWAKSMLDKVGTGTSIEELSKVVETINMTKTALVAMGDKLVGFSGMSEAAVSKLIEAAGGIGSLTNAASSYYDNFYEESEKAAGATKQVSDALAAVGLSMPATRAAYRELVESNMKLGEAGAPAVAALLAASGAFAQFTPVAVEAAKAADTVAETVTEVVTILGRTAEDIAGERSNLQDQYDELTMNEAQLLGKRRALLDSSNQTLFDNIQAILAANKVADKAAEDKAKADAVSIAAADKLAATNKGWQDQLDALNRSQMNATQLMELETAGMEDSTRAIYNAVQARKAEIQAINDQAVAIEKVKADAKTSMAAVDEAMNVVRRVADAEKKKVSDAHSQAMKNLQQRVDLDMKAAAETKVLSDALRGTSAQLRLIGLGSGARADAQAQVKAALAIARAGGPLPSADSLKGALSVLTGNSQELFSSLEDYQRDFYRTQNDLTELGLLADTQLSVEQQMLAVLNSQKDLAQAAYEREIGRLDDIVLKAQAEVDLLKGIDTSLLTISGAISGLAAAILNAQANPVNASASAINQAYQTALGRAPEAAGMGFWQDQIAKGVPQADVIGDIMNSPEAKARALFQSVLGRDGDAAGIKFWTQQLTAGVSEQAVRDAMMQSGEFKKLRGFDVGTNFVPYDMDARIHRGEAIIPAADNRSMGQRLANMEASNGQLAEAVARSAAIAERQQAALDKIASNTLRSADTLDVVTEGGEAMRTV